MKGERKIEANSKKEKIPHFRPFEFFLWDWAVKMCQATTKFLYDVRDNVGRKFYSWCNRGRCLRVFYHCRAPEHKSVRPTSYFP